MGLNRVPSSLLLSPELPPQPGHETGSFLVEKIRSTARARMLGHSRPATALNQSGTGHGGPKLNRPSHPNLSFITPPSHLTRPPNQALPSSNIFPTSSSPTRPTTVNSSQQTPVSPQTTHHSPIKRLSSPFRPTPLPADLEPLELTTPLNDRSPPSLAPCPRSSLPLAPHIHHAHQSPTKPNLELSSPRLSSLDLKTPSNDLSPPSVPVWPRSHLACTAQIATHIRQAHQSPSKPNLKLVSPHLTYLDLKTPLNDFSPPAVPVCPRSRLPLATQLIGTNQSPTKASLQSPNRPALPLNMAEEDTRSEVSSELDVQPPPPLGTPTRANIQTLLLARDSPGSSPRPKAKARAPPPLVPLPEDPASHNLLALHAAVERALLLHLATEGTRTTLTTTTTTTTTTTPSRSDRMRTPDPDEPSSSTLKTFRLSNLISWPDLRPIVERGSGKRFTDTELSQLLWIWKSEDEGGLGFVVSAYGLGIELTARENEYRPAFTLCSPGKSKPQPEQTSSGKSKSLNGMNVIAMWSSQVEARKAEVRRRLEAHFESSQGQQVPMAQLPLPPAPTSVKKKRVRVAVPQTPERDLKRAKASEGPSITTEGRAMSLMERIKAKEAARKQESEESVRAELRKKSILSRLPELVESVYMVFVSPLSSPSRKKPSMVLGELAEVVAKSSRVALSEGEAIDSIKLLASVCPEFVKLRTVGKEEWVVVPELSSSGLLASTKEKVRKELLTS